MSPTRPLKPCAHPGCNALSINTRCELHTKLQSKQADDRRESAHDRGYTSRWR